MNEAQALTLEAGKFYRTRGGQKAEIVAKGADGVGEFHQFIGWRNGAVEGWREDGRYRMGGEYEYDLVAEWVEPKRIKGWLTITDTAGGAKTRDGHYFAGSITLGQTKDEALAFSTDKVVACIEIDVLEGHGLNGEAA